MVESGIVLFRHGIRTIVNSVSNLGNAVVVCETLLDFLHAGLSLIPSGVVDIAFLCRNAAKHCWTWAGSAGRPLTIFSLVA
jgi:hypothetical protein